MFCPIDDVYWGFEAQWQQPLLGHGCSNAIEQLLEELRKVPILTRLGGRVLLSVLMAVESSNHCSNPHPAWRPGAASASIHDQGHQIVPILTRLGGRVLLDNRLGRKPAAAVPILTRLGGRVLHQAQILGDARYVFQSSPGLEAGCCGDCIKPLCDKHPGGLLREPLDFRRVLAYVIWASMAEILTARETRTSQTFGHCCRFAERLS